MAKRLSIVVAAIPVIALTLAIPFVNYDEPRVLGFPFLFAWIMVWVAATTLFMWIVHRHIEGRR